MQTVIGATPLAGTLAAIPSKSMAHRLLIAAALADRPTEVRFGNAPLSEDIQATLRALTALGSKIVPGADGMLLVTPGALPGMVPELDCGESGSTLRFLLPVAAALTKTSRFTGRGRLPERPLAELCTVLTAHGVAVSQNHLPLELKGSLQGGEFILPGNVSSQYITGLLLALPLLPEGGTIRLTTPLESAGYVAMTLQVLRQFGIAVEVREDGWTIPAQQRYRSPGAVTVEGDWSNAAFFLAAGALNGKVTVTNLRADSAQGDRQIAALLRQFGAVVTQKHDAVTVASAPLHGITVDVSAIPDLLPVLAVLGMAAEGRTVLGNAARVRLKESDRLASTAALVKAVGGRVEERPDALIITGNRAGLHGGAAESFNDHRLVMAAAVAAVAAHGGIAINGAEAVNKSYPGFFRDWAALGGTVQ